MSEGFRERYQKDGGAWVIGQAAILVLLLIVAFLIPPILKWPEESEMIRYGIGAGLIGLGGFLALSAAVALGPSFTPMPRPKKGSSLKKSGPYGLVRHPIYGGVIVVAIGISTASPSPISIIVALGLAVFLDRKATREEVWLRKRYPEFSDYRARTRKLIPGIY